MGAEQSAPRAGSQPIVAVATSKTCYYEVLGVDRQVPDDEIRKAYKRKALELHPDRNFNDVENATRRFAEVQTAYEILSDPQERAWYDTHRDAILNGDPDAGAGVPSEQSGSRYTSATAIFSLMGRFNSSVPMTDNPAGFYGILNAFFDQLASEENSVCDWDGIPRTDYPPFGRASDDYDEVAKPFYRVWSGFSTKKSFSWKDKYRLSEAPDRRIRRLMEKENRKLRDEGIREFNDAVQSLVTFVKKRDPRYIPNTQSEAERQQILRNSAAAQAARARAAHQEKLDEYIVPDWAQPREDGERQDEFSQSDEDSEVEILECVVCNKTFKSEKQYEAHEKSKKHTKAIQQLRWQMKKENANLDLENESVSPTASVAPEGLIDEEVENKIGNIESPASEEVTNSRDKNKEDYPQSTEDQEEDEEGKQGMATPDSPVEDDEYAPRSAVAERILGGTVTSTKQHRVETDDEGAAAIDSMTASVSDLAVDETSTSGKKIGKAKLKREKKLARQAAEIEERKTHKCAVCAETFASRSKLFDHIKEFDHAASMPKPKGDKKQR
ncbi:hypothetical protein B0H63DRAFT_168910 [Podospora didyma]|uniref:Uncharacterized protein n=1 Tax=Podospora didyma TaxID=330526 RepID=A0AAE0NND8_9PEZI|nr:hypothetical protein B0H63DRAFT_168910 [Podospora didyma]